MRFIFGLILFRWHGCRAWAHQGWLHSLSLAAGLPNVQPCLAETASTSFEAELKMDESNGI